MNRRADRRARRDELARRLTDLGAAPVATPEPARIDAGEVRLRAVHAQLDAAAPTSSAPTVDHLDRDRRSRRRAVAGSVAGVAFALGALAVLALARPDGGATSLELTAAEHATIVLPDGQRIPATPGATVPDGARLEVDDDGSVTIDGVVVGPGRSVRIVDGEVVADDADPDASGAPTGPGTTQAGADPTGTASTDSTGADASTGTTAVRPTSTTARPASTTTARPTPPSTAPPTTVAPAPDPVRLRADATVLADGRVRVRWSPYSGSGFRAYLVLARSDGAAPRRPDAAGTTVLARRRDVGATTVRVPYVPGMTIRVVVIDTERRIVGLTKVLAPTPTVRIDPTTTSPSADPTAPIAPEPSTTPTTVTTSTTFATRRTG